MDVNFKLVGAKNLDALIKHYAEGEMQKRMRRAVGRAARLVVKEAKARVPVRTGALRKSIKVDSRRARKRQREKGITGVWVKADWPNKEKKPGSYYAMVYEYGSQKRKIAARPFLHPAVEAKKSSVEEEIVKELKKMLDEMNREMQRA